MKTVITLEIDHSSDIRDLADLVSGRAWTIDKVTNVVIRDPSLEVNLTGQVMDSVADHMVTLESNLRTIIDSQKSPDANVEAIRKSLLDRSKVGLEKYGVTTERSDLSAVDWVQHLQEELLDAAVYLQPLKNRMLLLEQFLVCVEKYIQIYSANLAEIGEGNGVIRYNTFYDMCEFVKELKVLKS